MEKLCTCFLPCLLNLYWLVILSRLYSLESWILHATGIFIEPCWNWALINLVSYCMWLSLEDISFLSDWRQGQSYRSLPLWLRNQAESMPTKTHSLMSGRKCCCMCSEVSQFVPPGTKRAPQKKGEIKGQGTMQRQQHSWPLPWGGTQDSSSSCQFSPLKRDS